MQQNYDLFRYTEIRLLENFGGVDEIYDMLKKFSSHVIVTKEEIPYLHYHCLVETGKSLNQVKQILYKKQKFKIYHHGNDKIHVDHLKVSLKAYIDYMFKQSGESKSDWTLEEF